RRCRRCGREERQSGASARFLFIPYAEGAAHRRAAPVTQSSQYWTGDSIVYARYEKNVAQGLRTKNPPCRAAMGRGTVRAADGGGVSSPSVTDCVGATSPSLRDREDLGGQSSASPSTAARSSSMPMPFSELVTWIT